MNIRKNLLFTAPKNPTKIHYIWLGGPIWKEYLRNMIMLAEVAQKSGHEVNLWMENEDNFYRTMDKIRISLDLDPDSSSKGDKQLGIRLRNISELEEKMTGVNQGEFYRNRPGLAQNLLKNIALEMTGSRNYAAASDLIRYEILRQEPGPYNIYLDTDTTFPNLSNKSRISRPDRGAFRFTGGITANVDISSRYSHNGNFKIKQITGGNDIIAASPDHEVIQTCIVDSMSNYSVMNLAAIRTGAIQNASGMTSAMPEIKIIDQKRLPSSPQRRHFTIASSGPGLFCAALKKFCETFDDHSPEALHSMTLRDRDGNRSPGDPVVLGGIEIQSHSDLTWLGHQQNPHSYDTDSVPKNTPFFFSYHAESGLENKQDNVIPAMNCRVLQRN